MRQVDRFDKLAEKFGKRLPMLQAVQLEPLIAQLLRAEHQAVVRMVKAYCKQCGKSRDHHLARHEFTAASFFRERIVAANYILHKLSARGK